MAGAAGFGISRSYDRSVVRAQRQRLGRYRRVDFIEGQSVDVVGWRYPTGLWAGCGRSGGRRSRADDPKFAFERRTAADFGAIPVRRGRDLRFPFRAVGGDVIADSVYRAVVVAVRKNPFNLLRFVSGCGGDYVDSVKNAQADDVERAVVPDRKTFESLIRQSTVAIRLEYRARRAG